MRFVVTIEVVFERFCWCNVLLNVFLLLILNSIALRNNVTNCLLYLYFVTLDKGVKSYTTKILKFLLLWQNFLYKKKVKNNIHGC